MRQRYAHNAERLDGEKRRYRDAAFDGARRARTGLRGDDRVIYIRERRFARLASYNHFSAAINAKNINPTRTTDIASERRIILANSHRDMSAATFIMLG